MKWLTDIVTEGDNATHCIVRWVAALGSVNGLGLAAYDVIGKGMHFDVQAYGIGFGAILAAVGCGRIGLGVVKVTGMLRSTIRFTVCSSLWSAAARSRQR